MDTKLKSNKPNKMNKMIGVFIGVLLIAALAVSMVQLYTPIYNNSQRIKERNKANELSFEKINRDNLKEDFIRTLYRSNFALNWDVLQDESDNAKKPSDIFLAENMEVPKDDDISNSKEEFTNNFNELLENWYHSFFSITIMEYPSFCYYIIDNNTGKVLTNSIDPLETVMDDTKQAQELRDSYPFYMVFKSGDNKDLSVVDYKGLEQKYIDNYLSMQLNKELFQEESYFPNWNQYKDQIETSADITIIYASQDINYYNNGQYCYDYYWDSIGVFLDAGFGYAYVAAFICILLLALILPLKKSWNIGSCFASRIPLEICAAAIIITIASFRNLASMAWESVGGGFLINTDYIVLSKQVQKVLAYGFNVLIWMIVFFVWYVGVLSFRQVFSLGLKRYLKEKTLTGRIALWINKYLKKVFTILGEIDLSTKSNRTIIKILAINFIILAFICCGWIFGIIFLIPYTIILFSILRKYLNDIKRKYSILLESTSKIAAGNLEVNIDENLGVFEPLKGELTKVQQGFIKAVKEETKSERMKTELITNVSHDLKTPLTAIITYIGLLKEGNVTDEERKTYINTLDMKSNRLKVLIEDLFELSKASTNNITLNIVEVDLVNLIEQVLLELDDKIKMVDIDFRPNLPEQKVLLNLDSEKTYRIFENLIINITKYAMPHTRAYIDMIIKEDTVVVAIKNMSATELNFNTDEISDRFVRGDISRNTEGSGLGLAITKSFVELQGGKFTIVADGDLFKAVIEWKKSK